MFSASFLANDGSAQHVSELWGQTGEAWVPGGRLPDFSFAGYHFGEDPLPEVEVVCSVKDFGAVGDGVHDDTQAFKDAIAQTESGAIFVPPGRYVITDILWIRKPNIVLRGASAEQSVLYCPTPLETILPDMSQTTTGRPTSNYSWSGGIVWIKGKYDDAVITLITASAQRGDAWLDVASTDGLRVGEVVKVSAHADAENTLVDYLYSGDAGDVAKMPTFRAGMRARIKAIDGQRVELERSLSFDVRPEWNPSLKGGGSSVYESGVEELGFEFPNIPYEGHFTEPGYNALAINGAVNCWVRNVRIFNSDSGIFGGGYNCTFDGVLVESERETHKGKTGHHGLQVGRDSVLENFDIRTEFIHDVTVDGFASGNVIKNGRALDMSLDHHRRVPYQNLFSNLDCGEASNIWRCGGGQSLGKNCAARGTFWRLQAKNNIAPPPSDFGPPSMNFVGLTTDSPSVLEHDGIWWEAIPPEELTPIELHAAQLARRLATKHQPSIAK
ncbi:hypothetical protein GCM10007047_32870 [Cerasicoccus arenae]|uniref:Rhamnogalacturonase A/B/Epimerase-like pectate lyase domain-containing protein n=2 Tax=Cerasicoccus arenae TaxID=424488 RepID=A0A8J3DF79_9BACT|nr:hypothetical protein GCM10007047_32870 [Cerasicoccus arenae]